VTVQKGAGVAAGYPDSAYAEAGAELAASIPRTEIPGGAVAGFADPAGNAFYVFDMAPEG